MLEEDEDEDEEEEGVVQAAKKTKTCEGPREKWVRGEKGVAMRRGGGAGDERKKERGRERGWRGGGGFVV